MTRPEAMKMIAEYEGKRPRGLDKFLSHVGLSEEEFMEVALSHGVSPYRHDVSETVSGPPIHDYDHWPTSGEMERSDTEAQLERWRRSRRTAAKPQVESAVAEVVEG
jgi:hypothetical protein